MGLDWLGRVGMGLDEILHPHLQRAPTGFACMLQAEGFVPSPAGDPAGCQYCESHQGSSQPLPMAPDSWRRMEKAQKNFAKCYCSPQVG